MSTRIKSTKPNNKNDFDTNNEPCGPNLEYDPEYVTLMAKVLPKGDAQYGDFIGVSETPNWGEIEKDCERLLTRTRDINLILLLLRCKIRQNANDGRVGVGHAAGRTFGRPPVGPDDGRAVGIRLERVRPRDGVGHRPSRPPYERAREKSRAECLSGIGFHGFPL